MDSQTPETILETGVLGRLFRYRHTVPRHEPKLSPV